MTSPHSSPILPSICHSLKKVVYSFEFPKGTRIKVRTGFDNFLSFRTSNDEQYKFEAEGECSVHESKEGFIQVNVSLEKPTDETKKKSSKKRRHHRHTTVTAVKERPSKRQRVHELDNDINRKPLKPYVPSAPKYVPMPTTLFPDSAPSLYNPYRRVLEDQEPIFE